MKPIFIILLEVFFFNSFEKKGRDMTMPELKGIFDTHSHYDDSAFEDPYGLIESLFDRGVSGIIHAATDIDSSVFGIETAKRFADFYTSVGIHPENADTSDTDSIQIIKQLASSDKVVAIGEIGLDYHYEGFNKQAQLDIFYEQIALANSLGLPVIVHCRDAVGDCMDILHTLRPKGVMHCFSGSCETAKELLELGMYISFTGVLTFKNAKKSIEVLKTMPIDRLLLETDCPYMSPEPYRGKRCDSSMIQFTAQKAAEVMAVSYESLIQTTCENAHRLFRIKR